MAIICILGGGSWGTALGIHLAQKHQIHIWEFFKTQADEMQQQRLCRLLPGISLPSPITVYSDLKPALQNAQVVILAVPSDKVEATIGQAKSLLKHQPIIIASKGFDKNLQLLSTLVQQQVNGPVYCLYGPTHAEEVSLGLFSGLVLAGGKGKEKLQKMISSPTMYVELSNDLIGVQVSAALKNILAVLVGIIDGKKVGDNAKAFVMTKGLEEIQRVGIKLGGKAATFYGLAGVGDMIVTCGSIHSRNFHVGKEIGKGRKLDDVLKEMKMVAEGITTLQCIPQLVKQYHLKLPLLMGTYDIVYQGKEIMQVLRKV